jgi:hypothetical protein
MIYSIDLLAQLLSCFGRSVQLQDQLLPNRVTAMPLPQGSEFFARRL